MNLRVITLGCFILHSFVLLSEGATTFEPDTKLDVHAKVTLMDPMTVSLDQGVNFGMISREESQSATIKLNTDGTTDMEGEGMVTGASVGLLKVAFDGTCSVSVADFGWLEDSEGNRLKFKPILLEDQNLVNQEEIPIGGILEIPANTPNKAYNTGNGLAAKIDVSCN